MQWRVRWRGWKNNQPSFSFVTFTKATELPDVDAAGSADRGTVRGTAAPYQAPVKHNGAARANNGSTTRRFAMTQLKWWLVGPNTAAKYLSDERQRPSPEGSVQRPISISGLQVAQFVSPLHPSGRCRCVDGGGLCSCTSYPKKGFGCMSKIIGQ